MSNNGLILTPPAGEVPERSEGGGGSNYRGYPLVDTVIHIFNFQQFQMPGLWKLASPSAPAGHLPHKWGED